MTRGNAPDRGMPRRAPLDGKRLDALALAYVGRYATTRAKLASYLKRKLVDRGWDEDGAPPIEAVVARFADLGYVDDAAFAAARGGALVRRGYGHIRVARALRAAGIDEDIAAPVLEAARDEALEAALRIARRRRLGPFAESIRTPEQRRRDIAALVRAGHSFALASRIALAPPGASLDHDQDAQRRHGDLCIGDDTKMVRAAEG